MRKIRLDERTVDGPGPEEAQLIEFQLDETRLKLRRNDRVFSPTLTTKLIGNSLTIEPGAEVLDLGCGIGPLGIYAALKGAASVTCLDIMPEACSFTRYNAALNGVDEKVRVVQSDLFQALNGSQFDIIVDDVSGLADEVARVSSWFPEPVPTGGQDGAAVTLRMLDEVKNHLKPGGRLYFPAATLGCVSRVIHKAQEQFGNNLELLVDRMIPFSPELYRAHTRLERLREEGIIDFSRKNSRCLWNLKIFMGRKA